MNKRTMTKRFYLGSKGIAVANEMGDSTILTTLGEATEQAKEAIENGDDIRYVVEVVRVIRRARQPIVVEDIRK